LGEWVLRGWEADYELHVWGFHETKYGREEVEVLVGIVREMFEKAKGTLAGKAYQT
jgi:Archaeal PaREP1/PaREP8 family.